MLRHSCVGLALTVIALQGQTISFFREFSTAGIAAVTADASGIYAFGNAGVRKYDFRGDQLWARESSAPTNVRGAAADATGVYVVGFIDRSGQIAGGFVRKHSAGGDELWTREFEFSPLGGLAADGTGVYVAGGNYTSAYVRKYSPDGAALWTSRFGEIKTATGVAVEATGVYVQVANSNGSAGVAVRKWDARGNELWTRELNPSDVPRFDSPRRFAAAAPAGFHAIVADARGRGTFLRKYDSAGNELWSRSAPQGTVAVEVDATGVYLVGSTGTDREFVTADLPGHCKSSEGGDAFALRYDPDGREVWTRQFGASQGAGARGVAVNASGVFVVGDKGAGDGFRSAWELFQPFEGWEPERGATFLAKFEKNAAPAAGPGPRIFPNCVVNAASYLGGGVTPGEIVTIFGSAMGASELVPLRLTEERRLATTLADTRILFNGVPAPLVYVSDKQSSAIVPYGVAGRSSVDVQVEYKGVRSEAVTMPVLPSRPGIFSLNGSGQGQGAILNEDGSLNSPSNPARRGSIISIFGTGGGEAVPGVVDGQILSNVLPQPSLPVSVFFDLGNNEHLVQQRQGEVLYAGGVAGSVAGLLQVNVRVPANAVETGNAVPFALFIGSHWTMYQVTLALR